MSRGHPSGGRPDGPPAEWFFLLGRQPPTVLSLRPGYNAETVFRDVHWSGDRRRRVEFVVKDGFIGSFPTVVKVFT